MRNDPAGIYAEWKTHFSNDHAGNDVFRRDGKEYESSWVYGKDEREEMAGWSKVIKNSKLSVSWLGKVIVLHRPEIFEEYQPEVGKVYPAEICRGSHGEEFCILRIRDKRIILRACPGGPGDRMEKTERGTVLRTGAEYLEVRDVDKCPVCGTEECSFVYLQKGKVVGCDCCVTPVDIWEVPDADADDGY